MGKGGLCKGGIGSLDEPGRKLCGASPAALRSVLTRPLLVSRTWGSEERGIVRLLCVIIVAPSPIDVKFEELVKMD